MPINTNTGSTKRLPQLLQAKRSQANVVRMSMLTA